MVTLTEKKLWYWRDPGRVSEASHLLGLGWGAVVDGVLANHFEGTIACKRRERFFLSSLYAREAGLALSVPVVEHVNTLRFFFVCVAHHCDLCLVYSA